MKRACSPKLSILELRAAAGAPCTQLQHLCLLQSDPADGEGLARRAAPPGPPTGSPRGQPQLRASAQPCAQPARIAPVQLSLSSRRRICSRRWCPPAGSRADPGAGGGVAGSLERLLGGLALAPASPAARTVVAAAGLWLACPGPSRRCCSWRCGCCLLACRLLRFNASRLRLGALMAVAPALALVCGPAHLFRSACGGGDGVCR